MPRHTSKNITADNESVLKELSVQFATNYCTVSFGEKEKKHVKLTEIFKPESETIKKYGSGEANVELLGQHRNIVVIGAGASYDSFKDIALGKEVVENLKKKYEERLFAIPALKEKYDTALYELKLQGRDLDFENYLSILSELMLTPDGIRQEIHEFTDFRHSPSLFYEIIAHLFKHSFIDVIINFNFDELLDNAIEEELGRDNYYHILSDGDCIDIEEIMVDGRLKVPIYIKPHGTVSHKSTLRFTKRHYLDVPDQIKKILIDLVKGKRGEGKIPITSVNLIAIGYNMQSIEFTAILNEHLPPDSRIYHFMYEKMEPGENGKYIQTILADFYERALKYVIEKNNSSLEPINIEAFNDKLYKRIAIEGFNTIDKESQRNELTSPYAELFSYIWRETFYQFVETYRPRSIGRHEIIAYLFYHTDFANARVTNRKRLRDYYQDRVNYFRDKVLVEIAIAINRNNGMIDITEILKDRVGVYYDLYIKACKRFETSQVTKIYTLYELIDEFSADIEKDFSYSRHFFRLSPITNEILDKCKKEIDKTESHFRKWIIIKRDDKGSITKDNSLIDQVFHLLSAQNTNLISRSVLYFLFKSDLLSARFIQNLKENHDKHVYNARIPDNDNEEVLKLISEIGRLFRKSVNSHYYQIRPRFKDRLNYLVESFSRRKIQHTNLALEYNFRHMLLKKDWDRLLIISETGSLLDFLNKTETQADTNATNSFLLGDKKIIIINAYEAIQQLFPIQGTEGAAREQKDRLLKNRERIADNFKKIMLNVKPANSFVTPLTIPAAQHNQHIILFLKKVESGMLNHVAQEYPIYKLAAGGESRAFSMVGSFYMHRPGFSNCINPIFVGNDPYGKDKSVIENDLKKIIRVFAIYFCRAINFENIDKSKLKGIKQDTSNFLRWSWEEEKQYIEEFLNYMYDLDKDDTDLLEAIILPEE